MCNIILNWEAPRPPIPYYIIHSQPLTAVSSFKKLLPHYQAVGIIHRHQVSQLVSEWVGYWVDNDRTWVRQKDVFSSQFCYEMGSSGFKTKGRLLRLLMDLISSETGRRQIIIKFVNSRRLAAASSHKTRIRKINSVGWKAQCALRNDCILSTESLSNFLW